MSAEYTYGPDARSAATLIERIGRGSTPIATVKKEDIEAAVVALLGKRASAGMTGTKQQLVDQVIHLATTVRQLSDEEGEQIHRERMRALWVETNLERVTLIGEEIQEWADKVARHPAHYLEGCDPQIKLAAELRLRTRIANKIAAETASGEHTAEEVMDVLIADLVGNVFTKARWMSSGSSVTRQLSEDFDRVVLTELVQDLAQHGYEAVANAGVICYGWMRW